MPLPPHVAAPQARPASCSDTSCVARAPWWPFPIWLCWRASAPSSCTTAASYSVPLPGAVVFPLVQPTPPACQVIAPPMRRPSMLRCSCEPHPLSHPLIQNLALLIPPLRAFPSAAACSRFALICSPHAPRHHMPSDDTYSSVPRPAPDPVLHSYFAGLNACLGFPATLAAFKCSGQWTW